jgi:hypothetical protein
MHEPISEGRNAMWRYSASPEIRRNALRLLTMINETQAHGYVGARVIPSAAADEAGLTLDTERYVEALWLLIDEEALVGPSADLHLKGWQPEHGGALQYTERAEEMLRNVEEMLWED